MKPRLVIIDGVRTPFCKAGTDLAHLDAVELGRIVVTTLLQRTGLNPALIDEVIFGCVSQPADAANIARVIALRSGIPEQVPAVTIHRNCASGLESLTMAYEKMCAGHGEVFIVGGTESMSQVPLFFNQRAAEKFSRLARAKTLPAKAGALAAFRPRDAKPRIGLQLGLTDPVSGMNMGDTAELLAREFHLSREAQDAFALESHQRAVAARGKLADELCPILHSGNGPMTSAITLDNGPRENQNSAALAKLRPVFDKKFGTVTAGNSSQITDGAVALLVMEVERARGLGLAPSGALVDYAVAGCDPKRMGLGPVFAMAKLERQTGLRLDDADLIEINEAFAAQTLAVLDSAESSAFAHAQLRRDMPLGKISRDKLNVNGGAIALGHPVGATGARLILTSLKELQRRNGHRALISLCVGGGQGAALWLERMK
ncbi:MAG TPA: thiolase family protein [Verrucomicrobiae bacterium]|jgi:acetyl-CoA C-acetyltransferase/acetyl-CoA acyltransferase